MRSSISGALTGAVVALTALALGASAALVAIGVTEAAHAASLSSFQIGASGQCPPWSCSADSLSRGQLPAASPGESAPSNAIPTISWTIRPLSGNILRADDELGVLARSMSRVPPRIRELVRRVSLEAARRDAILAGMVEGLLAVDQDLRIVFCNEAFARVAGVPGSVAPGAPLVRLVAIRALSICSAPSCAPANRPARGFSSAHPEGRGSK